jgi:hypothetical protein
MTEINRALVQHAAIDAILYGDLPKAQLETILAALCDACYALGAADGARTAHAIMLTDAAIWQAKR